MKTRRRRRIAVTGLALACGLAVVTAAAIPALGANTVKVKSKITIKGVAPRLHGRVKSAKADCVRRRKVELWQRRFRTGQWRKLGTDKTNHYGKWKIKGGDPHRLYIQRAKVLRSKVHSEGKTLICKSDKAY
jgi:hypothetical protein